jgi:hypothetical protein
MRSLRHRKCREASRAEPPAPTAYPLPKTLRVFDLPARGRFRAVPQRGFLVNLQLMEIYRLVEAHFPRREL